MTLMRNVPRKSFLATMANDEKKVGNIDYYVVGPIKINTVGQLNYNLDQILVNDST